MKLKLKKRDWIIIGLSTAALVTVGIVAYRKRKGLKTFVFKALVWYLKPIWDAHTELEVRRLHPKFRDKAREFINRAEKELGVKLILTSGYRTFAQQDAQHRANSKNPPAGRSNHNYGFALDVNAVSPVGLRKASSKQAWINSGLVSLAKKMGMKWGGDFKSYHDPIHFYEDKGTTTELLARVNAGKVDKQGYVRV